jgi:hypothetical protein
MVKAMETGGDQMGGMLTQGSSYFSRKKVLKVPHQLEKFLVLYIFFVNGKNMKAICVFSLNQLYVILFT